MTYEILIGTRNDLYITSKTIKSEKHLTFNEVIELVNCIFGDNVEFIGGTYSKILKKTCYEFISECLDYMVYIRD